ncbi:MAG: hypothetical protein ISR65_10725 [Bacteriovoracaceae bacterium]|nr:hypothetical protein [Bacteriovoracaceae bacterium]
MKIDYINFQDFNKSIAFKPLKTHVFRLLDCRGVVVYRNTNSFEGEYFKLPVEIDGEKYFTFEGPLKDGKIPDEFLFAKLLLIDDIKFYLKKHEANKEKQKHWVLMEDIKQLVDQFNIDQASIRDIVKRCLFILRSYVCVEHCSIFLNHNDEYLECLLSMHSGHIILPEDGTKWPIDTTSVMGIAAINQAFYFSNDLENEAAYKKTDFPTPRNLGCFPLVVDGKLIGVLNLSNKLGGSFSYDDVDVIGKLVVIYSRVLNDYLVNEIIRERQTTTESLGKYISHNIQDEIEHGRFSKRGDEVRQKAICLFADIRSFTSISEKLDPKVLVKLLNIYFSELIPIIERNHGTVDKLVGDMIAAFWNVPKEISDPELHAVKAAIEMQKAMVQKVVPHWRQGGVSRMGIGIGLNSGNVIAGNIGSSKVMNYTVVGDAVQDAEMLESNARPGQILVSQRVYKCVAGKVLRPKKIIKDLVFKETGKKQEVSVIIPIDYPDY